MSGDAILRLMVALAIGLIVGLERGWREREAEPGSRTAGIRTYGLSGLLGGIVASIAQSFGNPVVFGVAFVVFAVIFAWFKRDEGRAEGNFSVTAVIAGLVVFAAGGLAVIDDLYVASAVGVATAILLASREVLHNWLRRLTWPELRSALLLLAMTALVLPVLPDRSIDPFGGVNPRQIWLFTILAAGVSFAGYVGNKVVGPTRGLAVLGIAGGVVSSTIVTIALANRSRIVSQGAQFAGGALLASMVSVVRVLILSSAVNVSILGLLGPPIGVAALVFGGWGAALLWRAAPDNEAQHLDHPLTAKMLFLVACSIAIASFVFSWLSGKFNVKTLMGAAVFAGLIDIDALALSTVRLSLQAFPIEQATLIVGIGLVSNATERAAFAAFFGSRVFLAHYLAATLLAAIAGGSMMWWIFSATG